jgi:hypothetical protein
VTISIAIPDGNFFVGYGYTTKTAAVAYPMQRRSLLLYTSKIKSWATQAVCLENSEFNEFPNPQSVCSSTAKKVSICRWEQCS